jgi:hypothetical protein
MSYTFPRRVAYIKSTSGNVGIANAGSILAVLMTEVVRINVPSLPVPVRLAAKCTVQNASTSGTNLDAYAGLAPAGAVGVAVAAAACIDTAGEVNVGGSTTEPPGQKLSLSFWLPENSGGDYILGVWRETGSDTGTVIVNGLVPVEMEAVRG